MERREAPGGLRGLLWASLAIGPPGTLARRSAPSDVGGGASRRFTAALYRAPLPASLGRLMRAPLAGSIGEAAYSIVGIKSIGSLLRHDRCRAAWFRNLSMPSRIASYSRWQV